MNAREYRLRAERAELQLAEALAEKNLLLTDNARLSAIVNSEDRLALVQENEALRNQVSSLTEANAILGDRAHTAEHIAEEILNTRAAVNAPRPRPEPAPTEEVVVHKIDDKTGYVEIEGKRLSVIIGKNWVLRSSGTPLFRFSDEGVAKLPQSKVQNILAEAVAQLPA